MWYSINELAKLLNTTEKQLDKKINLKKLESKTVLQNLKLIRLYKYIPEENPVPPPTPPSPRKRKKLNWDEALEKIIISNGYIANTDFLLQEILKYKTSKSKNLKMRISNTLSVNDQFIKLSHRIYGLKDHLDKISKESYEKYYMELFENGKVVNDFTLVQAIEKLIIENGYVASLELIYDKIFKGLKAELKEKKRTMTTILLKKRFVRVGPGSYALKDHLDKIRKDSIQEKKKNYHNLRWVLAIEDIIIKNDYLATIETICSSIKNYINSKAKTNYDAVSNNIKDKRFFLVEDSLYGLVAHKDKITKEAIQEKRTITIDKTEKTTKKITWADAMEKIIIENGGIASIQKICESAYKYKTTTSTYIINIVHPILIRNKRFAKAGNGMWKLNEK